jgi:hypothetical protein
VGPDLQVARRWSDEPRLLGALLDAVDSHRVRTQSPQLREHLAIFGDRLPAERRTQLEVLEARLGSG